MCVARVAALVALCVLAVGLPRAVGQTNQASSAEASVDRALAFEANGKTNEAFHELFEALKASQDGDVKAQLWYHIGKLHLKKGNGFLARLGFQNALGVGWDTDTAGRLRGEMLESARRLLATAQELEQVQKSSPDNTASVAKQGASPTSPASVTGAGLCKETLAHLSSRLPAIANQELSNLRNTILSTKISDVAASITAQGIPLARAASLVIQQSQDNQKTLDGSKTCAAESFDGSGTDLASALDRRQYDLPLSTRSGSSMTIREMAAGPGDSNIFRSCLRAFIAADMSKIATDETAVQLTCRATRRP